MPPLKLVFWDYVISPTIVFFGKFIMSVLLKTCHYEVIGLEKFNLLKGPRIVALWHNRIFPVARLLIHYTPFNYSIFVSESRDGELLASFAESFNQAKAIRVPRKSRSKALQELIQEIKSENSIAVITPDGPRGPKYKAKPGVFHAATKTGASIIPLTWHANRYWELGTWDKFRIPKPFAKIYFTLGEAIHPDSLEEVELALNALPSFEV